MLSEVAPRSSSGRAAPPAAPSLRRDRHGGKGQEDEDPRTGREKRDLRVPRPGHAREIAAGVAFLASPDGGGYTTGHSLLVDGGMALMGGVANSVADRG